MLVYRYSKQAIRAGLFRKIDQESPKIWNFYENLTTKGLKLLGWEIVVGKYI